MHVKDQIEQVRWIFWTMQAKTYIISARIKIHRYCAFFDLPVFPRKNCDLKPVQDRRDAQDLSHWPSCCTTLVSGHSGHSNHSGTASSPTLSMRSSPSDGGQAYQSGLTPVFPFSSHQSAKICLKSALSISQSFDLLPYPNPTTQVSDGPSYIGPFSTIISPRMMPSFACCAMQCAYVLLMVYDKTQTMYSSWNGDTGSLANNLLGRLQEGILSILGTLENYGTAFEALGGMRGMIHHETSTCKCSLWTQIKSAIRCTPRSHLIPDGIIGTC